MIDYTLLSKAINKLDAKNKLKVPEKINAVAFINSIDESYNTVDKYFISSPTPLLESGDEQYKSNTELASLEFPITLNEMLLEL